jgi:isoleucyl-tRNA synthetase
VTLRNIYGGMFARYANFGWAPSPADPAVEARPILDRWVLSRLRTVELQVDDLMQRYDATAAVRAIMAFVDEDVSNWYVRQTRSRFYDVAGDDNRAAFATLHEVLVVACRLLAPFAPFVTDWLHRQLVGTSVHLASYVRDDSASAHVDTELESLMIAVRTLATLGRGAREQAGRPVRQPLSRMVCVAPGVPEQGLREMLPVLEAELNIKSIELATSGDSLVTLEARPNFRTMGKKFGKLMNQAAEAVTRLSNAQLRAFEENGELALTVDGETHMVGTQDVTIVHRASGDLVVQEEHGFFAAIDPTITPALKREWVARELISRVQRMRKEAGLAVSDRIRLSISGDSPVLEAAEEHRARIADEVLASVLEIGETAQQNMKVRQTVDLDGIRAVLALTRDD